MNDKMTVKDSFKLLEESGGAIMKLIIRNRNGKPIKAVIFLDGEVETTEILEAIEEVERKW
jgi:hypothetical protein